MHFRFTVSISATKMIKNNETFPEETNSCDLDESVDVLEKEADELELDSHSRIRKNSKFYIYFQDLYLSIKIEADNLELEANKNE